MIVILKTYSHKKLKIGYQVKQIQMYGINLLKVPYSMIIINKSNYQKELKIKAIFLRILSRLFLFAIMSVK